MRIRLLTYNIHKAIGVDRRFDPDRIVAILRHHDADIALLQEVDRHAPRSSMLDLASYLARALDYRHHAAGMNVHLKRGRYGNATLSRFPIGRQRNIDLTLGARIRRGAQHTRIHIPANGHTLDLDVFNIHLSLTARMRRRQARVLLDSSDVRNLPPQRPCVIAGDTNDWTGELRRRFFEPAGFVCVTNVRPRMRWAIRSFPSYAPAGGLDKVFCRGPIERIHAARSRLALARVASDHLPVIVDLEL
ncbi:MAG: endonuclease [Planctomycetota bacterium]|nr:MAG: endonuclease [Planctomycetota bacterium]